MYVRLILTIAVLSLSPPSLSQSQTVPPESAGADDSLSPLDAGRSLYQQGRFDEALELFENAVRAEGRSASARYWLGMTWYALEDYDEALKAFRRAVQLDKNWAPGHVGMGMVYMSLPNRRLDARKAYREAAKADSGNAEIQYRMGLTYMDQERTGRLIGSDRDGRKYFLKTLEHNPAHPDAYFQLGRCYDSPDEPEYVKAISAYIRQYRVNPDHSESLLRFGNVSHRTERYDLGATELKQIVKEWGADTPDRIRVMLAQFEVLAMGSDQQYDQLQAALESYIAQLDADEQEVYQDLTHVAAPDELKAWEAAAGAERDALWRSFWNERDANPATIENERLVEHYRRVMYARIHFAEKQYPYDRRGEIYVRYGSPEDRRRFMVRANEDQHKMMFLPSGNPAVDAIREQNLQFGYQLKVNRGEVSKILDSDKAKRSGFGADTMMDDLVDTPSFDDSNPMIIKTIDQYNAEIAAKHRREMGASFMVESWVYVPHKLELFFVDQMGGGRYDYPLETLSIDESSDSTIQPNAIGSRDRENPRRRAAALIASSPEVYAHDFGGEPLQYAFDAVSFRGEGGTTEVDLSYSIPAWQFGDITDEKGDRTWLNHQVTLRDSVQAPAFSRKIRFGPIARPERQLGNQEFQGAAFTLAANVTAPSGAFTVAVEMRDEATKRTGVYKKPVSFTDYRGSDLLISDLKLSTGITPAANPGPFVRKGLNVVPNPGRLYARGQLVYVYYEVYNLDMDEVGWTSYETLYEITPMGMPALRNRSARRPGDMQTVMSFFEGEGRSEEEAEYTALDTTDLPAGEYVVTVTLTDRQAESTVSKSVNFMVVEP